jgi:hypothetical protein
MVEAVKSGMIYSLDGGSQYVLSFGGCVNRSTDYWTWLFMKHHRLLHA